MTANGKSGYYCLVIDESSTGKNDGCYFRKYGL